MEQSFTVPAGVFEVNVSFDMFVNTFFDSVADSGLTLLTPNLHARVDLLAEGSAPLTTSESLTDVLEIFYKSTDATVNDGYVHYSFDVTVIPTVTYDLRFAHAATTGLLHQGVDNVSVVSASVGTAYTTEDDAVTIDAVELLGNDSDVDNGDVLEIITVDAVSSLGASVEVDGNGDVYYDPRAALQYLAEGDLVADSFTYTISDGHGGTDSATVTIEVVGVNDAPVAVADVANAAPGGAWFNAANGHSYQLVSGAFTWTEANLAAQAAGGYLATITSASENAFVLGLSGTGELFAWIGGSDAAQEGRWVWEDGPEAGLNFWNGVASGTAPLGQYTNWHPPVPNPEPAGDGDYMHMWFEGTWNDQVEGATNVFGNLGYVIEYNNGVLENQSVTVDVLANDTDVDGDDNPSNFSLDSVSIAGVTGLSTSTGGSVSIVADQLQFNPGTDFDELDLGDRATVTVNYTMSDDSGASSSSTATIAVNGTSDAPTVENLSFSVNEDGPSVTQDFQGADVDTDNDRSTLSYTVLTPPAEGSLTNNNDSLFTFDPNGDFEDLALGESRQVSFNYQATDAHGATSGDATGTITVQGANDSPVAQDVAFNVGEDGPGVTVGFNASDVDTTDNLIFEIRSGPAGGSVVNNGDGTFTFNPDDDFQFLVQDQSRDVTFSYVAIDDSGAANHESALQTVTVTVDGAFDAPVQNAQEFLFGSENLNPWGPGAALSLVDVRFLGIDEFVSVGDTSIIDGIVLVPSFTTPAVYSPVIDIPAVYAPVLHFPATYAPVVCVLGVCVGGQKLTDADTTGGGLIAAAYTIGGDLLIPAFTTPAVETPDLGFGIDLGILFGLQSMFGMTAGEVDVGLPFDVVFNTPFQAENGQQITVSSSFAFLDSSSLASPTDTVGIDVLGPNVRYELDILVDIFGAMEFNVGSSSTTLTVIDEHNTHVENDPLFGDGILRGLNIIAFDAADDAVIPVFSNPASPVVNVDAFVPVLDSTGEIDGLDPSIWTSTASDPFLTGTLDLDAIASFFSTPVGPKFGFPYVLTAEVGLFPFSGEATLDIVDLDIVNSLTLN